VEIRDDCDNVRTVGPLSQHSKLVQKDWFENPQDEKELDTAVANMHDEFLQSFIPAAYSCVFRDTEMDRHWGMCCRCPEHIQARAEGVKHIECFWNSCRLAGASEFLHQKVADTETKARNLKPVDVGGREDVCRVVKNMLKKKASLYKLRFQWIHLVPWILAQQTR
jgi:hypothetical protein